MTKVGLVLVHGMGKHTEDWADRIKEVMNNQLPQLNIEPAYFVPLYSSIMEDTVKRAIKLPDKEADQLEKTMLELVHKQMNEDPGAYKGIMKDWGKWLDEFKTYVIPYLNNSSLREKVNDCVRKKINKAKSTLPDGRIILIGHSLGSVVSWNVACDLDNSTNTTLYKLLTLGSPLQLLHNIGVIKSPANLFCSWANIIAPDDEVSLLPVKDPPFGCENGLITLRVRKVTNDPHDSLVNDAGVISDWLPFVLI